MKVQKHARKLRQFKYLSKQLKRILEEKELFPQKKKEEIIIKLKSLIEDLKNVLSLSQIKKTLGTAVIFLGLGVSTTQAQNIFFAAPEANPFGISQTTEYIDIPEFVDIDNDGDLDLFVGTGDYGAFNFYENTGTASNPSFAAPVENPFGLVSTYYVSAPTFADLDGDGDQDLLVGEYYTGILNFYENTGTASNPSFAAPVENPFNLESNDASIRCPEFVDIDDDGDFDLFIGEGEYGNYDGNINYYENIGTVSAPNFTTPVTNPFGIISVYILAAPAFADIDNDGDQDLMIGEFYGAFKFSENTGTASEPAFAEPLTNPFLLDSLNYYNFPTFADIDNDGDFDLFGGEYYYGIQYFENYNPVSNHEIKNDFDTQIYPNPTTGKVWIQTDEQIDRIEIYDILGKRLDTFLRKEDVDLETYVSGTYFIQIINDKIGVSTQKIIKQ